jgi:hypothetical protein
MKIGLSYPRRHSHKMPPDLDERNVCRGPSPKSAGDWKKLLKDVVGTESTMACAETQAALGLNKDHLTFSE